jgi:PAS domain S-box-containing protein
MIKDLHLEGDLYRLVFDAALGGLLIENDSGIIVDANKSACDLFNLSRDELIKLSADELIEKQLVFIKDRKDADGKETVPLYLNNNTNKYISVRKTSFITSNDERFRLYTLTDVTPAAEIKRSGEKNNNGYNLADIIKDMIFIFDAEQNISYVNRRVCNFYGLKKDEIIGRKISEFMPEQSYNLLMKYMSEQKNEPEENQPLEIKISNNDDTIVNFEAIISSISNERIDDMVLIARDITYKKSLERQLQKSQRMDAVEKMAGGMAHDFNNLLTIILGNNKILLEKLSGQSEINQNLMQIEKASRRAETLTRQLLSFSGQQSLHPQRTKIDHLVSTLITLIEQSLINNITIVNQLEEGIGSILVDPKKLEISIYNLITTAAESMEDGGEIKIRSKEFHLDKNLQTKNLFTIVAGDYILLEIEYPGTEIEEDDLLNIFEPFQSNNKLYENNGLDLPSIYGFVKQSGGYIDIDSKAGVGTTFKLYFPISADEEEQAEAASEEEILDIEEAVSADEEDTILYKPNPTILVAEDEYDLNELICDVLVYNGYRIMFALNGKEALEIVENNPDKIDLILSDVIMPEMGGPEFVREAKKIMDKPLKIIYMSGYTDKAISLIESDDRKFEFLQKPFTPDDLLKKIRSLLDTEKSRSHKK